MTLPELSSPIPTWRPCQSTMIAGERPHQGRLTGTGSDQTMPPQGWPAAGGVSVVAAVGVGIAVSDGDGAADCEDEASCEDEAAGEGELDGPAVGVPGAVPAQPESATARTISSFFIS